MVALVAILKIYFEIFLLNQKDDRLGTSLEDWGDLYIKST